MGNESPPLLRGTLDVMILKALSWGPRHGYAIARWIEGIAKQEVLVEEGSLYPTLRRLESRGWVSSQWEISETNRRVKTYTLTEEGRRQLAAEIERWDRFSDAVSRVLKTRRRQTA